MHTSTNARAILRSRATRPASLPELADWILERPLGEGRWTCVYQARPSTVRGHADYAVKLLKPEHRQDPRAVRMLQREASVGREIAHPNVVSVLASHVDSPPFYVVTPYLEGATLGSTLRFAGRLETPHALWLARQIAEALQAMHEQDWLHADIKPDNLFVAASGHVTVCDLGLARRIEAKPSREEILVGTPAFLPPEAFRGTVAWTPASDVYSLGVTLYQALTGQLPFPQQSPDELAAAVLTGTPPDPRQLHPQLPSRVARLLRHLLAKDPLRRPALEELIGRLVELEIETFDERLGGRLDHSCAEDASPQVDVAIEDLDLGSVDG
jgi:serine/threonine protein kinase